MGLKQILLSIFVLSTLCIFVPQIAQSHVINSSLYNLNHTVIASGSNVTNTSDGNDIIIVIGSSVVGKSDAGNTRVFIGYIYTFPDEWSAGNATCVESWGCSAWSVCDNNQQDRTCTDANSCGTDTLKPTENKTCGSGGGSGTSDYKNFDIVTGLVTITEFDEGYSEFYEIVINASEQDLFWFEVPESCKVQYESMQGDGILTNMVSCYITEEPQFDRIEVKSSVWNDKIELDVMASKRTRLFSFFRTLVKDRPIHVLGVTISGYLVLSIIIIVTLGIFGITHRVRKSKS